jgi:hypothetical protein
MQLRRAQRSPGFLQFPICDGGALQVQVSLTGGQRIGSDISNPFF